MWELAWRLGPCCQRIVGGPAGPGRGKAACEGGGTGGRRDQLFTKQCKNKLPWVSWGGVADRLLLPPTWQLFPICVEGTLLKKVKWGQGWSQGNLFLWNFSIKVCFADKKFVLLISAIVSLCSGWETRKSSTSPTCQASLGFFLEAVRKGAFEEHYRIIHLTASPSALFITILCHSHTRSFFFVFLSLKEDIVEISVKRKKVTRDYTKRHDWGE